MYKQKIIKICDDLAYCDILNTKRVIRGVRKMYYLMMLI